MVILGIAMTYIHFKYSGFFGYDNYKVARLQNVLLIIFLVLLGIMKFIE